MAKYSFEFKKKVVLEYLSGGGGRKHLAKKYGIKSYGQLKNWIKAYNAFGDEGLKRSRQNSSYSFEFKLRVIFIK